jgi:hypothetical protein
VNAAVIGAGATFAGTALAGLLVGILLGSRTGQPLWVVGGVFAGLGIGAYGAILLILRGK